VFSCGFDSIPVDLGVLMLQTEMQSRFGSPANRVRKMKGTFSGATAASMQATLPAA
jgi:short subunit dehydrogenase-like uncharacterized protein